MASHLTLWLVLLACLRAVGLSQTQVPWQTSLAAFAFIRLLTALPITPGGLGITELGLVGVLATSADHKVTVQVTAAVLLYRAVTYLPPIPLGALACLIWRHAPALIGSSRLTPSRAAPGAVAAPDRPRQTSPPGEATTCDEPSRVSASAGGLGRPPCLRIPAEVAGLAAFACSDRVSLSTGAVYDISGGRATY